MCPIILGLLVLLLYYASSQLETLSLSEQVGDSQVVVAQNWEIVFTLWPLALFLFLLGVVSMLLLFRFRSMLKERREKQLEADKSNETED